MPGPLLRLFAYPVTPGVQPTGGLVTHAVEVVGALEDAYRLADVDGGLPVAFILNTAPTERTNEVRDILLGLAFQPDDDAEASATRLASRLATATDRRSKPALLVISVHGAGDLRQVVLWTFPKDEAFRFSVGPEGERIELVEDIFSRSSYLRKAASFRGRNNRTGFLQGRVVDFQANITDRYVADFWLNFLMAKLQMSGPEGTSLFATALRKTYIELEGDVSAQEQLSASVLAIRGREGQRMSIRSFADTFLEPTAREILIRVAPSLEAADAIFPLDRPRFDQLIQFRVFRLTNGVIVTAPFGAVGDGVTVTEDGDRRILRATGIIVGESIRARGG